MLNSAELQLQAFPAIFIRTHLLHLVYLGTNPNSPENIIKQLPIPMSHYLVHSALNLLHVISGDLKFHPDPLVRPTENCLKITFFVTLNFQELTTRLQTYNHGKKCVGTLESIHVIGLISREMGPNYSHGPWYLFECHMQLYTKTVMYHTFRDVKY